MDYILEVKDLEKNIRILLWIKSVFQFPQAQLLV